MNQNALKKNKRTRRRKEGRKKGIKLCMREGLKSNSWHAKKEMRPKNLLKNKKLKGIRLAY